MSRYAVATVEEVWSRGRLVERRLSHGEAFHDGNTIEASDARDDALVAWCDAEMERLRTATRFPWVRLIAEASTDGTQSLVILPSIVTDLEHLDHDATLMEDRRPRLSESTFVDRRGRLSSIVWRNGSAAVLLHEAFGHPLENGHADIAWPSWLRIEVPLAMRRASFRDVPLVRMREVRVTQTDAPFELPEPRIEVHLVDGGGYEPLTEMVTLRIAAADFVDGADVHALEPFELHQSRSDIARSIVGATGDPLRYPGVICSREGQELFVGSYAPVMITRFR